MTRIKQVHVVIKADTTKFDAAMASCAVKVGGLVEKLRRAIHEMHQRGYHWQDGRRVPARRCRTCNPDANPAPLTIDGLAYARRRKNRRGRR